jgi:hypothetical protein
VGGAELTQSGVIAQAFVHGEGAAQPGLLWPLDPAAATRPSNRPYSKQRALPDYARVHAWRAPSRPLRVAEQTLTANGRPRREAILQRYHTLLSDLVVRFTMSFFDTLQLHTTQERQELFACR